MSAAGTKYRGYPASSYQYPVHDRLDRRRGADLRDRSERHPEIPHGRAQGDNIRGLNDVLVGSTIATQFQPAVGTRIKIGSRRAPPTGRSVRVSGILAARGFASDGVNTDNAIVVPTTWYTNQYGEQRRVRPGERDREECRHDQRRRSRHRQEGQPEHPGGADLRRQSAACRVSPRPLARSRHSSLRSAASRSSSPRSASSTS